ncbi:SDR family oxidoreductase [Beijerinckia indica]|uniref:NAD-dependent epimerase/dehydratase n=1 Tax=Beijerinckia indica subsp. indica (strain ATCC 9039 / DSM 1715 / NCIMB 8712) TaxID=395963 RepID=B2IIZ1_BEII9|nr:SDR family oxidoreductase [Beijerinckia indica]ACB96203.1 NAD-dependent epimerase/dehydratase [Beijerinckia indica subsp. indica ATCC 9039]
MRIFVTGATGWVGSAVVEDLIAAGHEVTGLSRSSASAEKLAATGAQVVRGAIEDLDVLRAAAGQADAVIHTAFNHNWSRFAENCAADKRAIEVLGAELEGSERPLVVTSGVALLAPRRLATEADVAPPVTESFPRASEAVVEELRGCGVRVATVRLAPSVHGVGDHGFVPRLAGIARDKGVSAYIGDGKNRWPAVHRLDAARVFRLALDHTAEGPFHAVAEQGIALKDIAEAIARQFDLPLISISADGAAEHFGWFAPFVGIDAPTSSDRTRAVLDWKPEQPGLLDDLAKPDYFGS